MSEILENYINYVENQEAKGELAKAYEDLLGIKRDLCEGNTNLDEITAEEALISCDLAITTIKSKMNIIRIKFN